MTTKAETITMMFALDPTKEQEEMFYSHAGGARAAYNLAVDLIEEDWERARVMEEYGLKPEYQIRGAIDLTNAINRVKDEKMPWHRDNSSRIYNQAGRNCWTAVSNLNHGRKQGRKVGFPKRKSRRTDMSFSMLTSTNRLELDNRHFTLAFIGTVRLHENARRLRWLLKNGGAIKTVTVSLKGNRWFIAVNVSVTSELWLKYHLQRTKKDKKPVVGVDLGIKNAAVLSDGTMIENPRSYEKKLRKLRRLQKKLSRQQGYDKKTGTPASKRYERTRKQIRQAHADVQNQEKDFAHKLTKKLVDEYEVIGLEDLNVMGMMKNRRLSRHIAHSQMGRIKELLKYKADWYGSQVVFVDRFYPSSKTCSDCGAVRTKLILSEREYVCDACGVVKDRDYNAALNIEREAARIVSGRTNASGQGELSNGRGDESAGSGRIDLGGTVVCEVSSGLV